jgi:cell wall-associated NlpC family hydrolase
VRDRVIEIARACLNTPFRHQGRIPGLALDCAGLAIHVVKELGLPYKDMHNYSRVPHDGKLRAMMELQPCLEPVTTPEPGDVLLMRFGKEPTHVAIFTGTTIIHAYEHVGKVCEHGLDADWHAKVVAAFRIKA